MAILKSAPHHSTDKFTYVPKTGSFVAEESDFGRAQPYYGQIYDDAADEGFWLVSHKTGKEKPFVLFRLERSDDGDVMFWEYCELDERTGRPVHSGLAVIIYND